MHGEWKDIPGFEGLYGVNEIGEIYSFYTNRVLRPSVSKDGYRQCVFHKNKEQHIMPVHRAVALAYIPRCDESLVVNHKDENKLNNCVDNLEWVTRRENNVYMGNRACQARLKKYGKKFYSYNARGEKIGEYLGISTYARENGMSEGSLHDVIKENRTRTIGKMRKYRGMIFTDKML